MPEQAVMTGRRRQAGATPPVQTDGTRNLPMIENGIWGQGALLGGLLTFTSYKPYDDVCLAEGFSYLHGVYFRTGTAWYESVFGDNALDGNGNVKARLDLGAWSGHNTGSPCGERGRKQSICSNQYRHHCRDSSAQSAAEKCKNRQY